MRKLIHNNGCGDEVDDEKLLAYFHRWRTIKLLHGVIGEIGMSTRAAGRSTVQWGGEARLPSALLK